MTAAPRLRSPDAADCLAAIAEITVRGTASMDELHTLTACLGAARKTVQRQAAEALAALSARGVAVREVLLDALQSSLPRQRWGAAYALSLQGIPPVQALPVLLECIGNDDGDVRWAAANIVVRMRGQPDLVDTLRALLTTGNAAQRKMAAYCLRDLEARSPAVERSLSSALDDPDAGVRLAAMSSLARLSAHRPSAAQRLAALLDDADPGVRRAAAAVLGRLGEPSALVLAALRAASASTDLSLQRAAERSLRLLES